MPALAAEGVAIDDRMAEKAQEGRFSSLSIGHFPVHLSKICGGGNGNFGPHLSGRFLGSTLDGRSRCDLVGGRPDVLFRGGRLMVALARKRPRKLT